MNHCRRLLHEQDVPEAVLRQRGTAGGIRRQIEDGVNGFLVSSVEKTADRIERLLKDRKPGEEMGLRARETVRSRFLLSRNLEQYMDLFGSFETSFSLHWRAGEY